MTQPRLSRLHPLHKPSTSALPPITNKQHLILTYLFTYRFLTIHQLQTFLGHKQKHRIQVWLNDLIAKNYLYQIYDQSSFKAAGMPAIYYLATSGVRHLRQSGAYPDPELRNRYKEATRTQDFIDRCLLVADCAINLQRSSNELKTYHWLIPSDFTGIDEELPEALYLQELRPHLYFTNQPTSKVKPMTRYVLIYAQARLPHTVLRSRLKTLLEYAAYEWSGDEPAPATLIVCDTLADLIYVKRRVRYLLERDYDDDLDVRVTTTDKLRSEGVTSAIWEVIS